MQYVVIENTPGYMPEDDDPATFELYADAVAYLNDRASEYENDESVSYRVEYGWASSDNYAAVMVYDDSKSHDLGLAIEILRADEGPCCSECSGPLDWEPRPGLCDACAAQDDEGEVIVGCPGCGGYIDVGRDLCTNCALDVCDESGSGQLSLGASGEQRPLPTLAPEPRFSRCYCPDDYNCHYSWRTNFCGCKQHQS